MQAWLIHLIKNMSNYSMYYEISKFVADEEY